MKIIMISGMLAATFMFASTAMSAETVKLCTGGSNGVYFDAGEQIKRMAKGELNVEVIETQGTIDNLNKLTDGTCDAMIGQPDGPVYASRSNPASVKKLRQVASLHREYLHVLCGKESGVDDLGDLESDPSKYSIAIGEQGSGAWLIWQNLVAEDEDYGEIPVSNEGGVLALSSVSSGNTTCMLVPAGAPNGTVSEADSVYGDTVVIAGANDKDFNDAQDIKGKPLYEYRDIPTEKYPNSFNYWSDVSTISWLAGVYVNTDQFSDNKKLSKFIEAANRAAGGIKAQYGK